MGFFEKLFGKTKETKNMSNIKLAVIYYSSTGTNYQLAQWAAFFLCKNIKLYGFTDSLTIFSPLG